MLSLAEITLEVIIFMAFTIALSGLAAIFACILFAHLTNQYIQKGKLNDKMNIEAVTPYKKDGLSLAVILVTVLLTIALAVSLSLKQIQLITVAFVFVSAFLLIGAAIFDLKVMLIPNFIPLAIIIARLLFFICDFVKTDTVMLSLIKSLLGMVAVFLIFFVAAKLTKKSFGGGDVKLMSALGFMYGFENAAKIILLSLIIAVVVSLMLVLLKKKTMKDYVPLGPYILLGFYVFIYLT